MPYIAVMRSAWTAVYERRESGWIGYYAEHPEAGVIGHTLAEAREQLKAVMDLLSARGAGSADEAPLHTGDAARADA